MSRGPVSPSDSSSPHHDTLLPAPGTQLTIVKLRPDGSEATRYPAEALDSPPGWIVARATWGRPRLDLGYLVFDPDDVFLEYFSISDPFNAFAIVSSSGELKGWYCNVTHPTRVEELTVYWHDLYVDVIVYPDGRQLVLDEDELAEAELSVHDPGLYRTILDGRDRLLAMARERVYPFSDVPVPE